MPYDEHNADQHLLDENDANLADSFVVEALSAQERERLQLEQDLMLGLDYESHAAEDRRAQELEVDLTYSLYAEAERRRGELDEEYFLSLDINARAERLVVEHASGETSSAAADAASNDGNAVPRSRSPQPGDKRRRH